MTFELAIGIALICWLWYGLGVRHGYQQAQREQRQADKND